VIDKNFYEPNALFVVWPWTNYLPLLSKPPFPKCQKGVNSYFTGLLEGRNEIFICKMFSKFWPIAGAWCPLLGFQYCVRKIFCVDTATFYSMDLTEIIIIILQNYLRHVTLFSLNGNWRMRIWNVPSSNISKVKRGQSRGQSLEQSQHP